MKSIKFAILALLVSGSVFAVPDLSLVVAEQNRLKEEKAAAIVKADNEAKIQAARNMEANNQRAIAIAKINAKANADAKVRSNKAVANAKAKANAKAIENKIAYDEDADLRKAEKDAKIAKFKAEAKLAERAQDVELKRYEAGTDVIQSSADATRNISIGKKNKMTGEGDGSAKGNVVNRSVFGR